jgi:hypothetical protein
MVGRVSPFQQISRYWLMNDDPNSVTIKITKEQAQFVFKILEPNAAVRPTFTALLTEMRRKGWI